MKYVVSTDSKSTAIDLNFIVN